ncbi:DUF928 domain-containing protein [Nostoc sp. CHAB 5824]|nr:DUF928 domain-containing protein [Nostoc sp. CHAB 5824]
MGLPPSPQYALKTNNKYQWYFKVYCGDRQNTFGYFYLRSWLQRMPLTRDLKSNLKTAKSREYLAYAVNYIWQDVVTSLANMRRTNSSDRT